MTKLSRATRHSPSSRQNKKESTVLATVGLDLRFQAEKDSNTLGQQDLGRGGGGMGAQRPGLCTLGWVSVKQRAGGKDGILS